MRLLKSCAVLAVLFLAPALRAAEIARWQAGKPVKSRGMVLVKNGDFPWVLSSRGGIDVAALAPNHDYYRRAEFVGHVSRQVSSPFWVVAEYLDQGYGPQSVEGDQSIAQNWQKGETGKGRAIFFLGEAEPPNEYVEFVHDQLLGLKQLRPEVQRALRIEKPQEMYWSVLEGGKLALLNFTNHVAQARLPGGRALAVQPYGIVMTNSSR